MNMEPFRYLADHVPLLWWLGVAVLGLCVGSFLNVVIHRLPIMMRLSWREEYLRWEHGDEAGQQNSSSTYNLGWPRSACVHCYTPLAAYDNIPLLSWLLLRGKCRHCQQPINPRYPLVEGVTALLTLLTAALFPIDGLLIGIWLFSWWLIALAVIDLEHLQLPDLLTLPLLWLGLLFNLDHGFVPLQEAVLGCVIGYLALWAVYWGFKLFTGKEGLGYGDFKLLAALGAWLGWLALPMLLIIASITGILLAFSLRLIRKDKLTREYPFGPCLAFAGWLLLLFH